MNLRELEVLALDCQSTGANPRHGHLLEIAWSRGRAGAPSWSSIASHLVRLPRGQRVPARIRKLTGIQQEDMVEALPPPAVRRRLEADLGPSVAVAHFARFESTFLDALCRGRFPLDLVCTHEIACRLLPGLPRRGLRALAGYLGHSMGESKRAGHHVEATVAVWRALVERLADEGVTTLRELYDWMERVPPRRTGGREYPLPRERRLAVPDAPGVYRFLGKRGDVLYIGKATSLKARVNSYFRQRRHSIERTPELLTRAFDVAVTVTPTALEAALAETDAIKEETPPYNVALRRMDVHFASPDF
ncbi:MAG: GIY-YIG nuclease family protein, partial [Planctomycetota bacterium]|nr:GIY-YIG nuclease family protein [Planctomycetota bacterium]